MSIELNLEFLPKLLCLTLLSGRKFTHQRLILTGPKPVKLLGQTLRYENGVWLFINDLKLSLGKNNVIHTVGVVTPWIVRMFIGLGNDIVEFVVSFVMRSVLRWSFDGLSRLDVHKTYSRAYGLHPGGTE